MVLSTTNAIYAWVTSILSLAANIAVMIVVYLFNSSKFIKFIHSFYISSFIVYTLYYSFDSTTIFLLFLIVLLNNFLHENSDENESNDQSQENESINQNQENESIEQNNKIEESENSNKESKLLNNNLSEKNEQYLLEKINYITFFLFIFNLMIWIRRVILGIRSSSDFLVNRICYFILQNATEQFIFGIFVLKIMPTNSPKWLYFVYMIPTAILFPLSLLFSYLNKFSSPSFNSGLIEDCHIALMYYYSFPMIQNFLQKCKKEDTKNKLIQLGLFIVGFLWRVFVDGIITM